MILTGIPGWQGVMGWQRSQGLAHGFLLCQFLCLELFVVVGLLDTERIVEIVVVDGQPHGRELLHDVYLLRRVELVLLGIDELPSLDVETERRENRAHIFQAIDMKGAFSILR